MASKNIFILDTNLNHCLHTYEQTNTLTANAPINCYSTAPTEQITIHKNSPGNSQNIGKQQVEPFAGDHLQVDICNQHTTDDKVVLYNHFPTMQNCYPHCLVFLYII